MLASYLPQLFTATWHTLLISLSAASIGLGLGILGALLESSQKRLLRRLIYIYHALVRGLPEIVLLFIFYFGLNPVLSWLLRHPINLSATTTGIIALALLFGAYSSQVIRGAFAAIPAGQTEAAKALGLNTWQCFYHILLPQAWRHALPGLGNQWFVLLKDTALIALIGGQEIMSVTAVAAASTLQPFTFYLMAACLYLVLTTLSEICIHAWGRHLDRNIGATQHAKHAYV